MSKRRDALKDFLTPITSAEFSTENPMPRQRPQVASGALQSMNEALTGLTNEADQLRKTLADGQTIVEIDPNDIDASFIKDRLDDFSGDDFASLLDSIRENGQAVPVLVRPHPDREGRYQLAYGHRRVSAVQQLGLKAKAFIRDLSDDELVVAQGNENLERKDLSFIEKAFFALRLEERGVSRTVIMATFGTRSKGVLSEMISLVRRLPAGLVMAIGAASGVGRPKWEFLAKTLDDGCSSDWRVIVQEPEFKRLSSPDRFEMVFRQLQEKPAKQRRGAAGADAWAPEDKSVIVNVKKTAKKATLTLSNKEGRRFADFITGQLDDLYGAFQMSIKDTTGE